jgi:hypothetical protein
VTNAVVAFVAEFDFVSALAARAPAAAGLVAAFVLAVAAERDVAVASGLALIFFERALVAVAAFVPAAFMLIALLLFLRFSLPIGR